MILDLFKIRQHGGHFIPGYIRTIFKNLYILKGEILLFDRLYPATFICIGNEKYLVDVGNNRIERKNFFNALTIAPVPKKNVERKTAFGKFYSLLNFLSLFLAAYLITISIKSFEAGIYRPAALCILLGGIIFLICLYIKFKRR